MFAESGAPDGLQILELQCHQTLRIPTVERRSAFCTLFGTRLNHFSITLFCAGVRYQWQKPRIEVPPRAIDVCERLRSSFHEMHTCSRNSSEMKVHSISRNSLICTNFIFLCFWPLARTAVHIRKRAARTPSVRGGTSISCFWLLSRAPAH